MSRPLRAIAAPFVVAPHRASASARGCRPRRRMSWCCAPSVNTSLGWPVTTWPSDAASASVISTGLAGSGHWRRLDLLTARLARVEARIAQGRVSVVRGGRRLLHARQHLDAAGLTEPQWRQQWQAARWFLTADGDAGYPLGNGTILVHPEEGWLELKLPAPLRYLANRPHGRYRLSCPVGFSYRAEAWTAQVASGAVRYDICYQPERDRWVPGCLLDPSVPAGPDHSRAGGLPTGRSGPQRRPLGLRGAGPRRQPVRQPTDDPP
jgi:hypothetical protein